MTSTMRALPGLSNEVRHKLQSHRPRSIGHAGQIDGMTPAALTLLVAHIRRQNRKPNSKSNLGRGRVMGAPHMGSDATRERSAPPRVAHRSDPAFAQRSRKTEIGRWR